jgi:hypothetical protein
MRIAACSECFTNHKLPSSVAAEESVLRHILHFSVFGTQTAKENFLESEIVGPLRTDQGDA